MSLILPVPDWPAQDRAMWEALQMRGGPLDDQGSLAHVRATTLRSLQARYGRWLCWLSAKEPETIAIPPAERATVFRLKAWLVDLAHTKR